MPPNTIYEMRSDSAAGGVMLLITAAVFLTAWAVGVGIFDVGKGAHVLLLVGLMLLLLGFLKARDAAAISAGTEGSSDER